MRATWTLLCGLLLVGCGTNADGAGTPTAAQGASPDTSDNTSDNTSDDASTPARKSEVAFTHKMMKSTGENGFASLAYECPSCTFEQHKSIVPPEGWQKGPTQVSAFSRATLRSYPSFEGVPDAVDFLPEVPGAEYQLIAKNLSATMLGSGPGGLLVKAKVQRDTLFVYDAGSRIHEVTSPEERSSRFAYGVDPDNLVIPDFQDPDALGDLKLPEGWSYASRVLDTELLLDTPDVATVLAIRGGDKDSTWQLR